MDLLTAWHRASTSGLPADLDVWDAHTHTGDSDPDGIVGTVDALLTSLADVGHRGAVVMSSQEPRGYPRANDRILAEASRADGRLIPFLRVDPTRGRDALAEVERCLALGFRGVKLHPRGENFSLALPVVSDLVALAADAGAPVLIHAGRGIPPLGADVLGLLEAHDRLSMVMAHAAISDLAHLTAVAADHPGLFFDTAWWGAPALAALVAAVPPDRIVYASDTPYGSPAMASALTARIVSAAGYTEPMLRAVMGGTLLALIDGRRPTKLPGANPEPAVEGDPLLTAAHADLHGAIGQILAGGSGAEALQLAGRACRVDSEHPHAMLLRAVGRTIDIVDAATPTRADAIRTLIVAAGALLTPGVPVPDV